MEEIQERHPRLLDALRSHPHVGWLLVRSARARRASCSARRARAASPTGAVEGEDPLAPFSPTAAQHLRAPTASPTSPTSWSARFYDPALDEGCAFEELISFHGGLGGPQTRPFILAPPRLALPDEPILGAAAVHGVLAGWRAALAGVRSGRAPRAPARRSRPPSATTRRACDRPRWPAS